MSDSDSDFAYESAGEDAELEGSAANAKKSEAGSNKDAVSAETAETCLLTTTSDCMKDQLAEVTKGLGSLTSNEEHVSDGQDGVQCLGNTTQSESSVSKTSEGNETSNKYVNLVSQEAEPKRVKLRLEKKLMEKNQSVSSKILDSALSKTPDSVSNETPDSALSKTPTISSPTQLKDVPEEKASSTSSWGWGSWGTSLLSSAACSVTTFTSQVSQGIGTVLETVETTLGAPPPEELAASLSEKETSDSADKAPQEDTAETCAKVPMEGEPDNNKPSPTGLFSGVTSLTKVIENTGTKVIMGGLDTLELIGKKTIDILTEGDPGLRKKRAALSEGMTLSQILRDARNRAEERQSSDDDEIQEGVLYTQIFDDFQGLVHLEALEMLSKQCQSKVQTIMNTVSSDAAKKVVLEEIKDICEDLPSSDDTSGEEFQDFFAQVSELMKELDLPLNLAGKLEQVHSGAFETIHNFREKDDLTDAQLAKEVYGQAICCLADFTAKSVEHFHKLGELILVRPEIENRITHCTMKLADLTCVLSGEMGCLAAGFCTCLNSIADVSEDHDSVTRLITSVYLEASNSTTYIQDAFQLLIPVLQLAALQ